MSNEMVKKQRKIWLPVVTTVGIVLLWQFGVGLLKLPPYFIPLPTQMIKALFHQPQVWMMHISITLQETVFGFIIGSALGALMAICFVFWPPLEEALYLLVVVFQSIPKVAIAPLFLLWFGYGLAPKIAVVAVLCFFPVLVNTLFGLKNVDQNLIYLFRSVSAGPWQMMIKLRIPNSLPYMFEGLKIGITLSVIGAIVGEFVGANAGVGYVMLLATTMLDTAKVFAAILAVSLLGLVLFYSLQFFERWVIPWHHQKQIHSTKI